MSQKWPPTIPKDAARLGDLGKRVFGPKFQFFEGKTSDFHFWGFSDFGRPRIFSHFLELSFSGFPEILDFPRCSMLWAMNPN